MRARIEAAVERMIAALDALDAPAEDREEDDPGGASVGEDDEPEIGAPEGVVAVAMGYGQTFNQERTWATAGALAHDDDDDEGEPWLGASSRMALEYAFQPAWASGIYDDREIDAGDEGEPDVDGEPSLGSFDRMTDQRKSWRQTEAAGWSWEGAELTTPTRSPSRAA